MRNASFTLIVILAGCLQANAQACGGIAPCVPNTTLTLPGLSPLSQCLDPVVIGSTDTVSVQFINFDTVYFSGTGYLLDSLQLISIYNLPTGLCWATNKPNNMFATQENGCIQLIGTVGGSAGQYQLDITVAVWLHNTVSDLQLNAATEGLYYFMRVIEGGDTCPHNVDTTYETFASDSILPYTHGDCPGTGVSCAQIGGCSYMVANEPPAQSVVVGQNAYFIFGAGEAHAAYQWQVDSAGAGYQNLSNAGQYRGVTTNTLIVYNVNNANDSSLFRCIVTYGSCVDTTIAALLTVRACTPTDSNITTSICAGDTFHVGPHTFTQAGNYTDTITNACGGDSVVNLALTIKPAPVVSLSWDSMVADGWFLTGYHQGTLNFGNDTGSCDGYTGGFPLLGGLPAGGKYSGIGVWNDSIWVGFDSIHTDYLWDTITYTYINNLNCFSKASDTVLILFCSGIDEVALDNQISICPNPTTGLIYIQITGIQPEIIDIYDVNGRLVSAMKFTPEVDIQNLAPGAYLIEVKAGAVAARKMLLKM